MGTKILISFIRKLLFKGGIIELRPSRIIRESGYIMRKNFVIMQLDIFLSYSKVKLQFIKFTMLQKIFQSWMPMIFIVLLTQL